MVPPCVLVSYIVPDAAVEHADPHLRLFGSLAHCYEVLSMAEK